MDRTVRDYLRAVKRRIPLRDMRMRVLKTLRPACESFAAEHPDADRTAYYEHFGTPERIAADALENTEPDVLFRNITRARRIWIVALIASVLVVMGFWVTYIILAWRADRGINGHFGEEALYIVDYDENGKLVYMEKVKRREVP